MIIVMKRQASAKDVEYAVNRARSLGLKTHVSEQGGQTLIGLLGDLHGINAKVLEALRGVERVQATSRPFPLASLDFKAERTVVNVKGCEIGGHEVVVMAGPCSVESRDQMLRTAEAVQEAGAKVLRGGAFKPRSSPYSFRGLAEEGLRILAEVRERTGLLVITEVMSSEQLPLVCQYADILQIGTRNMHNFTLLHEVGQTRTPVLLKRGMMSTLQELLLSAEYVLSQGNADVILCERGIRTFETYTRNTLDINAVPSLRELTHLPVVVDPSHATGKSSLVKAASSASIAAGADGLLVEVHPDPGSAWSDGYQSLTPLEFSELMQEARSIAGALDRSLGTPLADSPTA